MKNDSAKRKWEIRDVDTQFDPQTQQKKNWRQAQTSEEI